MKHTPKNVANLLYSSLPENETFGWRDYPFFLFGVLPGLGAFWLIGGSEFHDDAHNEAHDAFMTLPP